MPTDSQVPFGVHIPQTADFQTPGLVSAVKSYISFK